MDASKLDWFIQSSFTRQSIGSSFIDRKRLTMISGLTIRSNNAIHPQPTVRALHGESSTGLALPPTVQLLASHSTGLSSQVSQDNRSDRLSLIVSGLR